jgi:hypothetical protein
MLDRVTMFAQCSIQPLINLRIHLLNTSTMLDRVTINTQAHTHTQAHTSTHTHTHSHSILTFYRDKKLYADYKLTIC